MCLIFLLLSIPIIGQINANYNKIETLQGRITRHYVINGKRQKTIGKFYFKSPDKLFIKYAKPEKTIVLNDTIIWVYLPEAKKALKLNYNELPPLKRRMLGIGTILGFNPLYELEKSFEFTFEEKYLIARPGHTPKIISKIIFEIDTRRNIILETQIFNLADSLIIETSYRAWENMEGIWFPQDITSKIYPEGKEIKERIGFHELFINYDIEDAQFSFTPPKGVEIME